MKKQISNVSILQNAKVAAALYFVMSIPFVIIMILTALVSGGQNSGPGIFVLILMPVFYVIFGFIFTAIGAWVYNLVATRVGGFEFTTTEVNK
jgi:hypothetical protein